MVKYTDETLKQLHSTILEMLIEFDRICRKYNIPYIIESGTLLGAVRNKGWLLFLHLFGAYFLPGGECHSFLPGFDILPVVRLSNLPALSLDR